MRSMRMPISFFLFLLSPLPGKFPVCAWIFFLSPFHMSLNQFSSISLHWYVHGRKIFLSFFPFHISLPWYAHSECFFFFFFFVSYESQFNSVQFSLSVKFSLPWYAHGDFFFLIFFPFYMSLNQLSSVCPGMRMAKVFFLLHFI